MFCSPQKTVASLLTWGEEKLGVLEIGCGEGDSKEDPLAQSPTERRGRLTNESN